MLQGHSESSNRTWATVDLGCPLDMFNRVQLTILKAWKLAGTTAEVTEQRRDTVRQQYQYLYQQAVEKGKLKEALHALDAQVTLDGLDQPPEGSLESKIIGGVITNAARSQLAELMNKARELAGRGVPKAIALQSAPELDAEPVPPGINGKVIDLRDGKK